MTTNLKQPNTSTTKRNETQVVSDGMEAIKKKKNTKAKTDKPVLKSLEVPLYTQAGKSDSMLPLPPEYFGLPWKADLVHYVANAMLLNKRAGTADTKSRGEVRGGGKKPWRQKGTGRARHGSSRSPIWKGGGVTHGPLAEKNYKQKINKKMKVKALFTALSAKAKAGDILFIDALKLDNTKTKDAVKIIGAVGTIKGFERAAKNTKRQIAIILPDLTTEMDRSFRNLSSVELVATKELNVVNILEYKTIIFVDPKATFALFAKKFA